MKEQTFKHKYTLANLLTGNLLTGKLNQAVLLN